MPRQAAQSRPWTIRVNALILALILSVALFEYLVKQGWLPSPVRYLPELIALVVAVYVVAAGARSRFRHVRTEYWVVFGALAIVIGSGILINAVEAGPLFAGLRTYLRALPLFFLPAVLLLDDRRLRRQLLLLLGVALLQVPIALYQRITMWDRGHISGDWVQGTLLNSAMLSIFLIGVACVLTGMFLRKRLSLLPYLLLLAAVLIPTTVNETKGTLLLLPIGLLTTFIVGAPRGARLKHSVLGVGVLAGFLAIFIPIYDYYAVPRWGFGIVDFFTEGKVERYLEKGTEVGSQKEAGRLDALVVPLRELARDPAQLAFGLGIGNASDSALGEQFTGQHFRRFQPFLLSGVTVLMLETGVLGLSFALLLYWLVFRDAIAVAGRDARGLAGALAAGWAGVVAVMTVAMPYKIVFNSNALTFLFFYFSGVVAARRMQVALRALPAGSPGRAPAAQPQLDPYPVGPQRAQGTYHARP